VPPGYIGQFARISGPTPDDCRSDGDIFVTKHVVDDGSAPYRPGRSQFGCGRCFAQDSTGFGIAFYPTANPTWLYVAETSRVVRFAFKNGDVESA